MSIPCPRRTRTFALTLIAGAVLAACGGGSDAPIEPAAPAAPARVTLGGVVADGPLQGATACYDLNDNQRCDSGEPSSAATDADGRYTLSVETAVAGRHAVIAQVPASAVDKDTGAAVGTAFTLRAPPTGTAGAHEVFVSPLSTVVAEIVRDSGQTVAEAAEQVRTTLGLTMSPLASFVDAGTDTDKTQAALAARALGAVMIHTHKVAAEAELPAEQAATLAPALAAQGLADVALALQTQAAAAPAARIDAAVQAVRIAFNLDKNTVKAVAEASVMPAAAAGAPGPFISVRRFTYTDAGNYSYTLFIGDSSQTDAAGGYKADEVRKTMAGGADQSFNRNQAYWTGSSWQVCALQRDVITDVRVNAATSTQTSSYCGASRAETRFALEDITGRTLREVVTRFRAYPLPDSVGAHTDADGLPVRWGPDPALLPADAVFPAGSQISRRRTRGDVGGTDRLELTTKSSVRWPDGRFRQATTLEQYGGMPGNLLDAAVVPANNNTVFVYDLPLAEQPDATLEAFKRWRAGFDMSNLKLRFYRCDVRKADQAALNCETAGDGTLALGTQGGARTMRVASGYPAELQQRLKTQRFWAEYAGTVVRGARDLETTRHDQRLNATAWDALRTALALPAHTPPAAAAAPGPFETLRSFSFTDAANYSWRSFTGDSSELDAEGYFLANETRRTRSGGVDRPFARNQLYWTGSTWYACPDDGVAINRVNSRAPFDSSYCAGYRDERAASVTLTLDGRRMSDVVNDIRAYGSRDGSFDYGGWGPNPSAHTVLASSFFPAGSTMEYRALRPLATPWTVGTSFDNKVRVAPEPSTREPFASWPHAASLAEFIAKYPGNLLGGALNGNTAVYVHGWDLPVAPAPEHTTRVEIRVAFDAAGQKVRFWRNNRAAGTGFTTNYVPLMDTTYTLETLGGITLLRFAQMPEGFEAEYLFQRAFAERDGAVWYAWKDVVRETPVWSIRLNRDAARAMKQTLGIE